MAENEKIDWAGLARKDFLAYCVMMHKGYFPSWHHKIIADELQKLEQKIAAGVKKTTYLILQIPPRHGKSLTASILFPTWILGRHPEYEVMLATYSQDLSTDFGKKARDIVNSDTYKKFFPDVSLEPDSQSKSKWGVVRNVKVGEEVKQIPTGGGYLATGVGGAMTGKGAHLLLIDDPIKSREEAESAVIREKVYSWFTDTALSRLHPNGVVVMIMQRWHKYDLVGKWLEENKHRDDIDIINIQFPAIAERDEEYRKAGEALWKERYDEEKLAAIRVDGEVKWQSQYQQNPILTEFQEFRPEYFRYFTDEPDNVEYTVCVDPAISQKENADNTAITVVAKERTKPDWYLVETIVGKKDPLEIIDTMFYLYDKYRPRIYGLETVAYQKSLLYFLNEEMKKRGVYLNIQEIKGTQKKEERIRGLIPLYRLGLVHHRREDRGTIILESELQNFPMSEHDDVCDSLSMHLQLQQNTSQLQNQRKCGNIAPLYYR